MQQPTLLQFPCSFPIKAMGKNTPEFEIAVLTILRRHCRDIHEGAIQTRESRGGRFLAITITINAENQQQLDNIYRDLSAHELVEFAL